VVASTQPIQPIHAVGERPQCIAWASGFVELDRVAGAVAWCRVRWLLVGGDPGIRQSTCCCKRQSDGAVVTCVLPVAGICERRRVGGCSLSPAGWELLGLPAGGTAGFSPGGGE